MPPSRHSSSSHSSHHSSHSSHHSSHRSSFHSRSSHSSSSGYYSRARSARRTTVFRPAYNQPRGYGMGGAVVRAASRVHCRYHDYTYYPEDWTYEGVNYKSGYYDETGNYYNRVVFRTNNSYKSEFKCEYCGNLAELTWNEGEMPTCKCCGASMIMTGTPVDEVVEEYNYDYSGAISNVHPIVARFIVYGVFIVIFLMIQIFAFVVSSAGRLISSTSSTSGYYSSFETDDDTDYDSGYDSNTTNDGNLDVYGSVLYLSKNEDGIYEVSDSSNYDKELTWDYGCESYYDIESDCYVWYNTEVSPNLWQYWYEDISSNYGDYGWMECENGKWYIEVADGDWEELEASYYEIEKLWHIKNRFD